MKIRLFLLLLVMSLGIIVYGDNGICPATFDFKTFEVPGTRFA